MYGNLALELRRKKITYKAVAELIAASERTVSNKVNGISDFTVTEVLAISQNLLPEFTLAYLFQQTPS